MVTKKALAALISLIFFVGNCVLASATESNVWKERRKNQLILAQLPSAPPVISFLPAQQLTSSWIRQKWKELPPDIERILSSIPSHTGTFRAMEFGTSDKIIIHIQDVHLNPEAQINISQTLLPLIENKKVDMVALEGSFASINLNIFREFPFPDSIKAVGSKLLSENKISGPIFSGLSARRSIPFFVGVDDKTAYIDNANSYLDSRPHEATTRKKISDLIHLNQEEKQKLFSPHLKTFDEEVQKYNHTSISLGEHLAGMATYIKPTPAVATFLKAIHLEKTLDFHRVEIERTYLLNSLASKLNASEISALTSASVAFRSGTTTRGDFYSYLESLCTSKGVTLSRTPSLQMYLDYVSTAQNINADTLFSESIAMERKIYALLIQSDAERTLLDTSRWLTLCQKLVNFSLTKDEWDEYKNIPQPGWTGTGGVDALDSFETFYRSAEKRDALMTQNLLREMDRTQSHVAVLVTGGFHAKGIHQKLTQKGVTLLTFVPKISKVEGSNGSAYLSVFAQEKTPLEKLFVGQKLFLAQNPIGRAAEFELAHKSAAPHLRSGQLPFGKFQNWMRQIFSNLFVWSYRNRGDIDEFEETWSEADGSSRHFNVEVGSEVILRSSRREKIRQHLYDIFLAGFKERRDDLKKYFPSAHPWFKSRTELIKNQSILLYLSDISFILLFLGLGYTTSQGVGLSGWALFPLVLKAADLLTLHIVKPIWHGVINAARIFVIGGATSSTSPNSSDSTPQPISGITKPKNLVDYVNTHGIISNKDQFFERFVPFWEPYITRTKRMILQGAEKLPVKESVTILGVGHGFDIPVEELARQFKRVNLVDIDEKALVGLKNSLPPELQGRIHLHVMDITGGAMDILVERALQILERESDAETAYDKMKQVCLDIDFNIDPQTFATLEASYVISSNVLSQLAAIPNEILKRKYHEKFNRFPERTFFEKNVLKRIHESHGILIARLTSEKGLAYFSADMKTVGNLQNLPENSHRQFLRKIKDFCLNSSWSKKNPDSITNIFRFFWANADDNTAGFFPLVLQNLIRKDIPEMKKYLKNILPPNIVALMEGQELSVEQSLSLLAKIAEMAEIFSIETIAVQIPGRLMDYIPQNMTREGKVQTFPWVQKAVTLVTLEVEAVLLAHTPSKASTDPQISTIYETFFEKGKTFPYDEESLSKTREGNWGVSIRDRFVQADGTLSIFYSLSALAYIPEGSELSSQLLAIQKEFEKLSFSDRFYPTPADALHLTLEPIVNPKKARFSPREIRKANSKTGALAKTLPPFKVQIVGLTIDPNSGRIMAQVFGYHDPEPRRRTITLLTPYQPLTLDEKSQLIEWITKYRSMTFGTLEINAAVLVHTPDSFGHKRIAEFTYPLNGTPPALTLPSTVEYTRGFLDRHPRFQAWAMNRPAIRKISGEKQKIERIAQLYVAPSRELAPDGWTTLIRPWLFFRSSLFPWFALLHNNKGDDGRWSWKLFLGRLTGHLLFIFPFTIAPFILPPLFHVTLPLYLKILFLCTLNMHTHYVWNSWFATFPLDLDQKKKRSGGKDLIEKSDIPPTAKSLEELFGENIRPWFELHKKNGKASKRRQTAEKLANNSNFWTLVDQNPNDFMMVLIRFAVAHNIRFKTKSLALFLSDLKRASIGLRKKQVPTIPLPLQSYLHLRFSLSDSKFIEFLESTQFQTFPTMDKLAELVEEIIRLDLPIDSDNFGHIHQALPAQLSKSVTRDMIRIVTLPRSVYKQVRSNVANRDVQAYLEGAFLKLTSEDRLNALVDKWEELGLKIGSDNLGHIHQALPAQLSPNVKRDMIQYVRLPRSVYKQVRSNVANRDVQAYLEGAFLKLTPEDRLNALVDKWEELGLKIGSDNLGQIYQALPAKLSPHITKDMIRSVSLPRSVYKQVRSNVANKDVQAYLEGAFLELTPEDRLNALVDKWEELKLKISSDNLGHIHQALPAQLSPNVKRDSINKVDLPRSVYKQVRSLISEQRWITFCQSKIGLNIFGINLARALISQWKEEKVFTANIHPAQLFTAFPKTLKKFEIPARFRQRVWNYRTEHLETINGETPIMRVQSNELYDLVENIISALPESDQEYARAIIDSDDEAELVSHGFLQEEIDRVRAVLKEKLSKAGYHFSTLTLPSTVDYTRGLLLRHPRFKTWAMNRTAIKKISDPEEKIQRIAQLYVAPWRELAPDGWTTLKKPWRIFRSSIFPWFALLHNNKGDDGRWSWKLFLGRWMGHWLFIISFTSVPFWIFYVVKLDELFTVLTITSSILLHILAHFIFNWIFPKYSLHFNLNNSEGYLTETLKLKFNVMYGNNASQWINRHTRSFRHGSPQQVAKELSQKPELIELLKGNSHDPIYALLHFIIQNEISLSTKNLPKFIRYFRNSLKNDLKQLIPDFNLSLPDFLVLRLALQDPRIDQFINSNEFLSLSEQDKMAQLVEKILSYDYTISTNNLAQWHTGLPISLKNICGIIKTTLPNFKRIRSLLNERKWILFLKNKIRGGSTLKESAQALSISWHSEGATLEKINPDSILAMIPMELRTFKKNLGWINPKTMTSSKLNYYLRLPPGTKLLIGTTRKEVFVASWESRHDISVETVLGKLEDPDKNIAILGSYPKTAIPIEDIFGQNIRSWYLRYIGIRSLATLNKTMKNAIKQILDDPNFELFIDQYPEDFGRALIRYLVERDINVGTKSLYTFTKSLRRAAPSPLKNKIQIISFPFHTYIHLRIAISDQRLITLLESDDFKNTPSEDRLALIVTKLKEWKLPIESETLPQIYYALPHKLSPSVTKRDIRKVDVPLSKWEKLRNLIGKKGWMIFCLEHSQNGIHGVALAKALIEEWKKKRLINFNLPPKHLVSVFPRSIKYFGISERIFGARRIPKPMSPKLRSRDPRTSLIEYTDGATTLIAVQKREFESELQMVLKALSSPDRIVAEEILFSEDPDLDDPTIVRVRTYLQTKLSRYNPSRNYSEALTLPSTVDYTRGFLDRHPRFKNWALNRTAIKKIFDPEKKIQRIAQLYVAPWRELAPDGWTTLIRPWLFFKSSLFPWFALLHNNKGDDGKLNVDKRNIRVYGHILFSLIPSYPPLLTFVFLPDPLGKNLALSISVLFLSLLLNAIGHYRFNYRFPKNALTFRTTSPEPQGGKDYPKLISQKEIPDTADQLESIFGENVRSWYTSHLRPWRENERDTVAQLLATDENFWAFIDNEGEDVALSLVRYLVRHNIQIKTLSLKSFLSVLKKAAPAPRKKIIPSVLMPLRTFLQFRVTVSDSRLQAFLKGEEYANTDREEKLGKMVEEILILGLPLDSENLGQLHTGLPPSLRKSMSKPDVTLDDFKKVRTALNNKNVQQDLRSQRFQKVSRQNKFALLIRIFSRHGYNFSSDNFSQIFSALPQKLVPGLAKSDIQKIEASRRTFKQFRLALKNKMVRDFLSSPTFIQDTSTEDKMAILVRKMKQANPNLTTDNLEHLYSLLPDILPGGVSKKDIQKVTVTLSQWAHIRSLLENEALRLRVQVKFHKLSEEKSKEQGPQTVATKVSRWLLETEFKNDPKIASLTPSALMSALPHEFKKNGNGKSKQPPPQTMGAEYLSSLFILSDPNSPYVTLLMLLIIPVLMYIGMSRKGKKPGDRSTDVKSKRKGPMDFASSSDEYPLFNLPRPSSLGIEHAFDEIPQNAGTIIHVVSQNDLNRLKTILKTVSIKDRGDLVVLVNPEFLNETNIVMTFETRNQRGVVISFNDIPTDPTDKSYSLDELLQNPRIKTLKGFQDISENNFTTGHLTLITSRMIPLRASKALAKIMIVILWETEGWVKIGLEQLMRANHQAQKAA